MEVIVLTFLNAVATEDILTASDNDVNLSKLKLSTLQTKTVVSFDRIGLDKLENDYAY